MMQGILIVDKPQGFTSHDVVAKLRGILKTKKVGHGGTLDPLATGVLPVFVGGATKAADYAAAQEKEYQAGFTLGLVTDTQDITGTIQMRNQAQVTRAQVQTALQSLHGAQKQIPPMYSAIKINGQKLYDLARQGKEIERPARDIWIAEIELLEFSEETQQGRFRVVCSKGTYVRTLIHDLGQMLGCGGVMRTLVRTRVGCYTQEQAVSLQRIEQERDAGTLETLLHPIDGLFAQYPAVELDVEGAARAARGATVFERMTTGLPYAADTLCRVYHAGQFWMLGRIDTLQSGGKGLFVHKNFR